MQNIDLLRLQFNHLVTQSRQDISALNTINEPQRKQQILQRLWDGISQMHFISELLANQAKNHPVTTAGTIQAPGTTTNSTGAYIPPITPLPNQTVQQTNQRTFTLEQLARYDGKNGMPAFVAVNGVVYDVTNNRAWAAATHFALTAGKDYTAEFASCHAGQQSILNTLPVVGRLVS